MADIAIWDAERVDENRGADSPATAFRQITGHRRGDTQGSPPALAAAAIRARIAFHAANRYRIGRSGTLGPRAGCPTGSR
ncbi:MAG: hypothetical protein M0R03_19340 [Novosphingobium sp.]|nr:hypothetical protein [Novosphingobium sp.]